MKNMKDKIKSVNELKEIIAQLKENKKIVVWTNGCFDILHIGHVKSLQKAKALGDVLIVGLNSDSSVRKLKGGGRPLMPQNERAEIIAALECVDYVIIFSELRPNKVINILKPDIHVKGPGYKKDELPETHIVKSYGGRIEIIDPKIPTSTTKIIKKILKVYKSGRIRSDRKT